MACLAFTVVSCRLLELQQQQLAGMLIWTAIGQLSCLPICMCMEWLLRYMPAMMAAALLRSAATIGWVGLFAAIVQ